MVYGEFARRAFVGAVLCAGLAGCATQTEIDDAPVNLGDFHLGYNIVVAKNAQKVPPSRDATAEEWEAALKAAIDQRFGRYEGEKLYHFGINVDGYALAVPGIPVVLAPKSALIISANLWDDEAGKKLHAEPKQMTIFEGLNGETIVGTGLTRSKQKQMDVLAYNTAQAIENWLIEHRAEWFGVTEGPALDGAETIDDVTAEAPVEGAVIAPEDVTETPLPEAPGI